ncbi:Hypothetical protein AKI40_0782 [Enterobacter sp. FY-07]|uniref:putative T6SS immunity periplasmic lipoprotein n=1 Tax=Kosakonia oryzendophytica TaxID=1005665 RepID=UPI0007778BA5|nr:putative T6SS immunity periplasmic lipoprotein [Kosakonia oryzendophytica]AMO47205.1 Hypothetical protein AKI40_0782 [Enterobacter sp. FY-07]WBT58945.1 hypothetical protein O9K67_03850 [Kosakonia oryzendophytica]
MKRNFPVIFFPLFLTGCPMGDRVPMVYSAKLLMVANSLCIQVQPEGRERMSSLWIEEIGNPEHQLQKYNIVDVPVSVQKCLPTYGYTFQPGRAYHVSFMLESLDKNNGGLTPASRSFSNGFTIWINAGVWQVAEL